MKSGQLRQLVVRIKFPLSLPCLVRNPYLARRAVRSSALVSWVDIAPTILDFSGLPSAGKVLLNDRIADSMFQQALLRPDEYSVLATTNLNGDYISDAAAAQVGGLGIAPGANIGSGYAVFEATHGTAPKYADKDMINPGSVILSGVMMFEYMGWQKVADMIVKAIETTISQKRVTYDFARQMEGAAELKCSEFASEIVKNL